MTTTHIQDLLALHHPELVLPPDPTTTLLLALPRDMARLVLAILQTHQRM